MSRRTEIAKWAHYFIGLQVFCSGLNVLRLSAIHRAAKSGQQDDVRSCRGLASDKTGSTRFSGRFQRTNAIGLWPQIVRPAFDCCAGRHGGQGPGCQLTNGGKRQSASVQKLSGSPRTPQASQNTRRAPLIYTGQPKAQHPAKKFIKWGIDDGCQPAKSGTARRLLVDCKQLSAGVSAGISAARLD